MPPDRIYVIAEAGVNHNGDLGLAFRLVDAAATAGADAVKFQTFRSESLVAATALLAEYQRTNMGASESQATMLRRLELDHASFRTLFDRAAERGIHFLSTPFDHGSLAFLAGDLKLKTMKIGSGDLTNAPLLLDAASRGCDVILSTGMATLDEVRDALGVLAFGYSGAPGTPSREAFASALYKASGREAISRHVTLLHCTTEYPAPLVDVNLRAMDTLAATFNVRVGYSDHTTGISVAIAAAARGAVVIEKHLTTDRTLPGPDHKASLEPREFSEMVAAVRAIETALGLPDKVAAASELKNALIARKSLVALRRIRVGDDFNTINLGVKRPGTGVSPMQYWATLGTKATRDYEADEVITP